MCLGRCALIFDPTRSTNKSSGTSSFTTINMTCDSCIIKIILVVVADMSKSEIAPIMWNQKIVKKCCNVRLPKLCIVWFMLLSGVGRCHFPKYEIKLGETRFET